MAELTTDAAALAKEASEFDRIAGELKSVIGQVESTGGDLASSWEGQAARAAQAALGRFHEAANKQIVELTDISNNIHGSSTDYAAAEEEQAANLAGDMNFG